MEFAVTQPFFQLQTPDFAWEFVWIVSANFEQNANFQQEKILNVKSTKSTNKYRSTISATVWNWPSYGYFKNSTSEVEVEAEVKVEVRYI